MTIFVFADNATSTLAAAISNTATAITLAPGTGVLYPALAPGQVFALTLNDAATRLIYEVCYCTSRTGDVLIVVRGQEGTTPLNWQIGDIAWNGPTSGQAANYVQSPHMLDGSISPTFGATAIDGNAVITGSASAAGNVSAAKATTNNQLVTLGQLFATFNAEVIEPLAPGQIAQATITFTAPQDGQVLLNWNAGLAVNNSVISSMYITGSGFTMSTDIANAGESSGGSGVWKGTVVAGATVVLTMNAQSSPSNVGTGAMSVGGIAMFLPTQ